MPKDPQTPDDKSSLAEKLLVIGKIVRVHGVKGWLKAISYTNPISNLLVYKPWQLLLNQQQFELNPIASQACAKGFLIHFAHCTDRDKAESLVGADIAIYRQQLPPPKAAEYYWADLEGMQVITREHQLLGNVGYLLETGSNDVLVVVGNKRHLIPFLLDHTILQIDLPTNTITVDWDPDF